MSYFELIKKITKILIWFFGYNLIAGSYPSDFFLYKKFQFEIDQGKNWDQLSNIDHSTFQKITYLDSGGNKDSLNMNYRIGSLFRMVDKKIVPSLYSYAYGTYSEKFYSYYYGRIINNYYYPEGYSGLPIEISRLGFNSAESDLAGLGYQNEWIKLQFARDREKVGSNSDEIGLVLNKSSSSYDYMLIATKFGKFSGKYFHGFLENIEGVNRYINGRSIQYSNNINFISSLSEIIIYSGLNRPLDFAYLNPLASHLEIEYNERQNQNGKSSGNAIWLVSLDWFFKSKFTVSANMLIDEFVIDNSQKEEGKKSSLATSFRLSRSINKFNHLFNFYAQYVNVGHNTFRHQYGYNNFVNRGNPLGWYLGNAGSEYIIGLNYYNSTNLFIKISSGNRHLSNNSIVDTPYSAYNNYSIKSDEIVRKSINFIKGSLSYFYSPNISLIVDLFFSSKKNTFTTVFGVDFYFRNKN